MTQVLQATEKQQVIYYLAQGYGRSEEEVERRIHKGLERGSLVMLDEVGLALTTVEVQMFHDAYREIWKSLLIRIEGRKGLPKPLPLEERYKGGKGPKNLPLREVYKGTRPPRRSK